MAAATLLLLVVGCSKVDDDEPAASASDGDPTAAEAATTLLPIEEIPAGSSLRVGDQFSVLELPLTFSGAGEGTPYDVEYSTFFGGPLVLEAFNAGEIDIAFVGDTPPVLAQAQGAEIAIVAAWEHSGNDQAIVAPATSGIETVEDLAGRELAYARGTASQAFALKALAEAGVDPDDVTAVELGGFDVPPALASGELEAGILPDPLLSTVLAENPDLRVIRDSAGLSTGLSYLLASRDALADPVKATLIGDYIDRLFDALQYANDNPGAWTDAYYEGQDVSADLAAELSEKQGPWTFPELDDAVFEQQQTIVDAFYDAGEIPEQMDAEAQFDPRYNPLIRAKNEAFSE